MSVTGGSSDAGQPAPISDSNPHDTQALTAEFAGSPESKKGLPDLPEGEVSSLNKVSHSRRTILPRKLTGLNRTFLRPLSLVKTPTYCLQMQYVKSDLTYLE